MTIKVTMFFQAFNYSWSEAHYLLGVSLFGPAVAPASTLAQERQDLLGFYAALVNVRLSYVPANRQVFDLPRTAWPAFGINNSGTNVVTDDSTDAPFTSLLVNLQNLTANKNLYIAGLPDIDVVFSPNTPNGFNVQADFQTPLNHYMRDLTFGNSLGVWGFRSRLTQPSFPVVSVQSEPLYKNNLGVFTTANPGIALGAEAYAIGFKTANPREPNLSGAYTVGAIIPPGSGQPNWETVLFRTAAVDPTNFSLLGSIQPLVFTYLPYQQWRPVRVTHRKRGGSYALPRGKSRVRR